MSPPARARGGGDFVERVRDRLVSGPADVPDVVADGLDAAVKAETSGVLDDIVFARLRREVAAEVSGAGPLEDLLAEADVSDVLVNGPDSVWVDRGAGLERAEVRFRDEASVRALAHRLAAGAGRRLDDAAPFVDAVLRDGTRMHAILPPLVESTTISLRVLARGRRDLAALVELGAMTPELAATLREMVRARRAFVITGGAGTGKTTLLGALLGEAAPTDRVVVIEDAPELAIGHPHVVRLVTRAANVEGAGAVGLRELVRQALRMRPDRLVVGEFRGAEMVDLLVALNTGHEGGAATMHANSAADVPARFAALGALAGLPSPAVTSLVASAIDLVVHLRRARDGRREVAEVGVLRRVGNDLQGSVLWTAHRPDALDAIQRLLEAGHSA